MRPLPELAPHWSDLFPEVRPTPSLTRCVICNERCNRAVCSPRCAAALAEMEVTFAAGDADPVADAMAEAAEHEALGWSWKHGRNW